MKKFLKILIILSFFTICFSQCKSNALKYDISKSIVNPSISDIFFQNWVAGIKGGGSGCNLYVSTKFYNALIPAYVYFRKMKVDFEPLKQNSNFYIARVKIESNIKKDYVMNSSSVDEYSNTSDILNKMLPFNLVKNDAVIVYNNQDKLVYIKVTNILEKEMIPFPVTPNNFGNHKLKIPE